MKSNFIALFDKDLSLFEVAYSAENLFVNNQYHYIPTALRLFTEGVMKEMLRETASDEIVLRDLIEYFRKANPSEVSIVRSANRLRHAGNDATHFKPQILAKDGLITLFEESIRLLNYYLKTYLKEDIEAIKFSLDSLPEPLFENVDSVSFSESGKYVDNDTEEKIKKYKRVNIRLGRELSTFKKALVQAEEKSSLINKEKLLLQNNIINLENKHSKLLMNIKESNDQSLNVKNNEVQDEIIILKHQVDSLEKQNKLLRQEQSIFEAKIIDNEVQQSDQSPR